MNGSTYLVCAIGLGMGFLYYGIRLLKSSDPKIALNTFIYSIIYLMGLFVGLLLDHYLSYFIAHF